MMTEEQSKAGPSPADSWHTAPKNLPAAIDHFRHRDRRFYAISSAMAELKWRAAQDHRPQNWIDLQGDAGLLANR